MQDIVDHLTAEVARQKEELEAYRAMLKRKNRLLERAASAFKDVLEDEAKIKEHMWWVK